MHTYQAHTFDIPELKGISAKQIELHLGLYSGYVNHVNLIHEQIEYLSGDMEKNGYAIAEMQRRLGFEFGGMRNHEYYFSQFEGSATELAHDGALMQSITRQWGSFENWLTRFSYIAATRGVGWAMLYVDRKHERLIQTWVDEQHVGLLSDLDIILGLDMWEHSYMADYLPAEKKQYIEAFFTNLNWSVVEKRLAETR